MRKQVLRFIFAAALLVASMEAQSQSVSTIKEALDDVVGRYTHFSESLTEFGDSVDLQSGALSFRQVDIKLEGQGPTISIEREFDVSARQDTYWMPDLALADWNIRVPRIYTNYREGSSPWEVKGSKPASRCTFFGDAKDFSIGSSVYPSSFWWKGYHLDVPGYPVQELMIRAEANKRIPTLKIPGQVGGFNVVSRDGWSFTCLPGPIKDGVGEGFIGISPDGTKYWFDRLITRVEGDVVDPNFGIPIFVQRTASLVATRVEDRFGNYVLFEYEGGLLKGVSGSDGRRLVVAWTGNRGSHQRPYSHVTEIVSQPGTSAERRWSYSYVQVNTSRGSFWRLSSIVLPDLSQWKFELRSFLRTCVPGGCNWNNPRDLEGKITSPSGASAIFYVNRGSLIIRNGEYTVAYPDPGNSDAYGGDNDKYSGPHLVKKRVVGNGIDATWKYSYSPASDYPPYVRAKTYIENPDGTLEVSHLDSAWRSPTEGRPWIVETYRGPFALPGNLGVLQRRSTFEYVRASEQIGLIPRKYANKKKSEYIWSIKKRTIEQDGARFSIAVDKYDAQGRPVRVTRSSAPAP